LVGQRVIVVTMFFNQLKKAFFRYCFFGNQKSRSLTRRFQMLLVFWGFIVYVISVGGFWALSNHVFLGNTERQAQLWASKIDMLSAPLYVSDKDSEFETIRRYITGFAEVSYIKLYRANGEDVFGVHTVEGFSESDIPEFDPAVLQNATAEQLKEGFSVALDLDANPAIKRVVAPVTAVSMNPDNTLDFDEGGPQEIISVLGYIDLGLNVNEQRSLLGGYILQGSLFISILFLVAAMVGRRVIEKSLRPLRELREPLSRLANGETDVWLNRHHRDDEIAAIGQALNTTVSAITVPVRCCL